MALALWFVVLVTIWPTAAQAAVLRRAVLIGNNIGNGQEETLLYAHDDARKIRSTLVELGEFDPAGARLLLEGSPEQLRTTFAHLRKELKAAASRGDQTLLFVYYSGHADEHTLHFGPRTVPRKLLLEYVGQSEADMAVVVLDACRNQAMVRKKGARPAAPFVVELDRGLGLTGIAVIESTAARQGAQESDALGGSVFSHYLVSGLMGAADINRDQNVSLAEACAYSYEHTLRATSMEGHEVQRPTFSFATEGHHSLILTRPRAASLPHALLELPVGDGFLVFAEGPSGPVVAEISRLDRDRLIPLRPGRYYVRTTDHLNHREGYVQLSTRQRTTLALEELRLPWSREPERDEPRCPTGLRWTGHRCEAASSCNAPSCTTRTRRGQVPATPQCTGLAEFSREGLVHAAELSRLHNCNDQNDCTIDTWNAELHRCQHYRIACACSDLRCPQRESKRETAPPALADARMLWLRADRAVSGQPVAHWGDPTHRHRAARQSIVDQRPRLAEHGGPCGGPAVEFDGQDDNLNLGNDYLFVDSDHSGMTVFAVVRSDEPRTEPCLLDFGYAADWSYVLDYDSIITRLSVPDGAGGNQFITGTHQILEGQWTIASYRVSFGETVEVRIRGEFLGSTRIPNVHQLDEETIRAHPHPIREYGGPVTIGMQSKEVRGDRSLRGAIAELQMYNEALTDQEMRAIECRLAQHYALPVVHNCP